MAYDSGIWTPAFVIGVTEQRLRDVVAQCRSWRGVLRALELKSSSFGPKLRNACNTLDIDYSHFRSILATDARLREVITTSSDWPTALAKLGYSKGSGTARATVRKHCNRLGIDTTNLAAAPPSPDPVVSDLDGLEPDVKYLRQAAPLMVLAAFALLGVAATLAPEGSRYDIVADLPGRGLMRIQVETGTGTHRGKYVCSVSRSEYDLNGSGGKRHAVYSSEEVDYFACVAGDLTLYLIPIKAVEGMRMLYLRKYSGYRVRTLYDGRLW